MYSLTVTTHWTGDCDQQTFSLSFFFIEMCQIRPTLYIAGEIKRNKVGFPTFQSFATCLDIFFPYLISSVLLFPYDFFK